MFCADVIKNIQKRYILVSLIFLLLISNTLVTMSINIAIVSMVNFQENSKPSSNSSNTNAVICPNTTFFVRDFFEGENEAETMGDVKFMAVPAGIYTIIGNWSPAQERGMFGASIVVGSGFGQTLGDICFGYVARYLYWEYVFYIVTIFGVIWATLWFTFVHDSPQQHPTIADDEKTYIEMSLQRSAVSRESVPWKSIFASTPFIVCALSYNALMWVFVVFATYTPIYLKTIYGLNANEIGIITSVCLFSTTTLAMATGYLSDAFVKKKIYTLTTVRITCTLLGTIISSIPLIVIAFVTCDINIVIVCLLLCAILKSCNMYGSPMGIVDLSPKFCGILEGICGTSGSIQTFIFSTIISYYSGILSSQDLWKYVFIYSALYAMLTNFLYIVWGSTEVQSWNFKNSLQK